MPTIKSLEELTALRDKYKNTIIPKGEDNNIRITVGMATCGIASGSRDTMNAMLDEIKNLKLDNVDVIQTGCVGCCYAEPVVEVTFPNKNAILYEKIDENKAREIIKRHIANGEIISDWVKKRSDF